MQVDNAAECDEENKPRSGICASIAALVVALEKAGALQRRQYEDILKHLWTILPDDEAEGDAGAVIEQVLDLIARHASDQTGRSFDLQQIKQSLTAHAACADEGDLQNCSGSGCNRRRSKHAPLLGAPFVV